MTDPSVHWYLNQVDLFKGIPNEEVMDIAKKTIEKECRKKELLYTPFDDSDSICILKKGEVTLYNSHLGKKLIIDVLKPGSIFGNIGFTSEKNTHFAEVTQDAYICMFKVEDFMKILQAKPELMLKFLEIMSSRLRTYENKLKTGLYDAKEKIIFLLEQHHAKRSQGLLGRLFSRRTPLTHSQIAHHTGLSRETVTRAITDLKKAGVIVDGENGLQLNS